MFSNETIFFGGFTLFTLIVMLFDLGAFSRKKSHIVKFKEAATWSAVWVSLSIAFYFFLKNFGYLIHDISTPESLELIKNEYYKNFTLTDNYLENFKAFQNNMALEYFTGYLVEYSLSVDNIFVFILIFNSFLLPKKHYKKVLVWGITGSVILRLGFIFLGAELLQRFEWVLYIFGAFLVFTGIKILFSKEEEDEKIDTGKHPAVRVTSLFFNTYEKFVADKFFIRHKYRKNKLYVTPLFLVIMVLAFTDVLFAVDSIPAIFSITKDPYIVFFSNVFAIMGLRSMFFFLVEIIDQFHHLKYGLGILLTFVGVKMLAHSWLEKIGFSNQHSLIIISSILIISIVSSKIWPEKK